MILSVSVSARVGSGDVDGLKIFFAIELGKSRFRVMRRKGKGGFFYTL